jgi:hypothetical protein
MNPRVFSSEFNQLWDRHIHYIESFMTREPLSDDQRARLQELVFVTGLSGGPIVDKQQEDDVRAAYASYTEARQRIGREPLSFRDWFELTSEFIVLVFLMEPFENPSARYLDLVHILRLRVKKTRSNL